MAFPLLRNSEHIVASVSKGEALFHRIAYDYSHGDWDSLHDHLRSFVPTE